VIDTDNIKNRILELAFRGQLTFQSDSDVPATVIVSKFHNLSPKRKRLLSDEKFEKPYDIPATWTWVRLGEIASYGDTPNKVMANDVDPSTWILDLEDIESCGRLLTKTRALDKTSIGEKTSFKEGQVLYSKLRPYLKKAIIADEDGICTPELIAFDTFTNINPRYVMRYLISPYVDKAINQRSYGIKMPRVDASFMVNLPVPLPPLLEQERIVERIEDTFSALSVIDDLQTRYASDRDVLKGKLIDDAICGKLTKQLPEDGTAEELYQQIQEEKKRLEKEGKIKKNKKLPEITEDEIPFDIPANWKWVRICDIFDLQSGKNITASDIYDDKTNEHHFPCYGGNGLRGFVSESNRCGDFALIGRQGALCGNINFAHGDFYATEHAVVVNHFGICDYKWTGMFLNALNLNQYATATAQPGLAVGKINKVLIPLPPLFEQQRIVETLDTLLENM